MKWNASENHRFNFVPNFHFVVFEIRIITGFIFKHLVLGILTSSIQFLFSSLLLQTVVAVIGIPNSKTLMNVQRAIPSFPLSRWIEGAYAGAEPHNRLNQLIWNNGPCHLDIIRMGNNESNVYQSVPRNRHLCATAHAHPELSPNWSSYVDTWKFDLLAAR